MLSLKYATPDSAHVLLLNGPPGTGKTTPARSMAEALGRKAYVLNLNGLAEANHIVGSETVWIGSQYGAVLKAIIETQTFAPVIILDELDKCGTGTSHCNVSDALLQLFDPSQKEFRDIFLGISYDTSRILFIATSNDINNLAPVLLNRVRVVQVDGYTEDEQGKILCEFIIPKLHKKYSQPNGTVNYSDEVIASI